jgi:hypothetical protein
MQVDQRLIEGDLRSSVANAGINDAKILAHPINSSISSPGT